MISHKLRSTIALALLRCLFPQGMSGARAAIVQPLRGSASPAPEHLSLVDLLQAPQISIDPAHPNRSELDLLSSLGSRLVRIPKRNSPDPSMRSHDDMYQQILHQSHKPIFGSGFKCRAQPDQQPAASPAAQQVNDDQPLHPAQQQAVEGEQ